MLNAFQQLGPGGGGGGGRAASITSSLFALVFFFVVVLILWDERGGMTLLTSLRVGSFVSVGGASGRASVAALAAGANIAH